MPTTIHKVPKSQISDTLLGKHHNRGLVHVLHVDPQVVLLGEALPAHRTVEGAKLEVDTVDVSLEGHVGGSSVVEDSPAYPTDSRTLRILWKWEIGTVDSWNSSTFQNGTNAYF